jgi:uncharacterized protein (TIGR02145 family)
MKSIYKISGFVILIIASLSCKKDKPVVPPEIVTTVVSEVLYTTATSGGEVTNDGGDMVARGVCWSTSTNPTINNSGTNDGTGDGLFVSSLEGLKPGTTYYLRAYATNTAGTVYGDEVSFKTHVHGNVFNTSLTYGTVSDIEGKSYKTIQIGNQLWMAENLRTTKLNDGSALPLVPESSSWSNLITPAYCWFENNDTIYENIYGAYYNWFAVSSGKLCPDGWHVPDDTEWQTLVSYLGGAGTAGSKLKATGTSDWILPNRDATNLSGFTALPAGMRESSDGAFGGQGSLGSWWSATEIQSSPLSTAWFQWVHGDTTIVTRDQIFKNDGMPVRCMKY